MLRERAKAASGAKVQVGEAAKFVGQQAMQIHGGVGMSVELKVDRYFNGFLRPGDRTDDPAVSHSQSRAVCMITVVQRAVSARDRAVWSGVRRWSNGAKRWK